MIELRTLGLLDLRGTDGFELRPVLRQPKRLALLAYLAAASPRRFHRRDSLLALFWPELDADHARAALRRALHFLRRSLGEDVLRSRGDEEIAVADSLWCDAVAYEEALATGCCADALALYRGAFLDGVYIDGAPEFERWVDETRIRLHEAATAAARAMAAASERAGDLPGAVQQARRAAALAPYDELTHRHLVALLDRAGDRAAALRVHEDFARRLRTDYELDVAAETRALVEAIRDRRVDAGTAGTPAAAESLPHGAAAVAPAAAETASPNVIAVLPFVVRGSRDLAYLAEGMVDLLSTAFDGAGDIRAVDPRALLSHLARESAAAQEIDPVRAGRVAERFGAGRFLLGSIVEAGGRLRVRATLYDDRAAVVVSAEVAGGGESGLFEVVDALARQILAGVRTDPSERLSRVAALTTDSIAALKAYLRGERDFRAGRYHQAVEAFQQATLDDPSFALAYYRLAAAAAAVAKLDLAREAASKAAVHRQRLAEHDRLLLDAQRAWLDGDADEAERLYAAVLGTHVDDLDAWFLLGDVLFHSNPLRGRSVAEARHAFERALRYDPDHVSSLVHLARIAALEGKADELNVLVEAVLRLSPAGDRAAGMRALRAYATGNELEKARVLTALGRVPAVVVGIAFSDIVLFARDIDGAHRLARVLAKLARAPEERALGHVVLAHFELCRGRQAASWRELELAGRTESAWALELRALFAVLPFVCTSDAELAALARALSVPADPERGAHGNQALAVHDGAHDVLREYAAGLVHARRGDAPAALAAAAALDGVDGDRARHRLGCALADTVRAMVAVAASDPAEALRHLERSRAQVWYQHGNASPFYARMLERYLRAELLRETGHPREALRWYGAIGESTPYEIVFLGPAHFHAGECCEQLGDAAPAAAHYAACARLWRSCDDGLRPVRDLAGERAAALRS